MPTSSLARTAAALCSVAAVLIVAPLNSTYATRPANELDDAMARSASIEQAPSGPSIQFAAPRGGTTNSNVGVVPVPEMSSFFPIVGLIVAVSCTQILRRRRAAQQSVFRR